MKRSNLRRAKDNAWKWFSLYIRTRDCIKTTRSMEYGNCVTCQRTYPLKSLQAGHFIAGRHNSVLFDEIGVNAQCYGCNVGKNGAPQDYWLWMEKEYGRDTIDELLQKRHRTIKYTVQDYQEIAETYKDKLSRLTLN